MSWERPCDLCRVISRADLQVRTEFFPFDLVCEGCRDELLADDQDPHAGEPECECSGGCQSCLCVRGWL